MLYSAAIPPIDTDDKTDGREDLEWGGKLDYDNPDNFTDIPDTPQRI